MTTTLLMRFAGPLQSWGTQSRFRERDTGREPSKSGVVGLLAAALGRSRGASVADLAALRMAVRIDRPGTVRMDYQTAGGAKRIGERYGVARAENPGTDTVVSQRAYLADASFLVGLEATTLDQDALLRQLNQALAAPVWPLFLGRKGYVPSTPIHLPVLPPLGPGLRAGPLEVVLGQYPADEIPDDAAAVSLVIETTADDPDAEMRHDWPLSFASGDRRFTTRYVAVRSIPRPPSAQVGMEDR